MAVCASRTSAAIAQQVPSTAVDWFVEWQRGITDVASSFDGYLGTDVYPPADDRGTQWVTVVHFEDVPSLERWIQSAQRAEWISKLQSEVGEFDIQPLRGGFNPWFTDRSGAVGALPSWKMAMIVLLGLYPTAMLLNVFMLPHLSTLGFAVSRFIGNAISVALLQWAVVPAIKIPLRPWLEANSPADRFFSIAGLIGLFVLLAVAVTTFHWLWG